MRTQRMIRILPLLAVLAAAPAQAKPDYSKTLDAFVAAFNAHDAKKLTSLYRADAAIAWITPAGWTEKKGREAKEAFLAPYFTGFPDAKIAISRVIQKDSTVIAEWVGTGTNAETKKKGGIFGVEIFWFDPAGLIRRDEVVFDEMTIAQQIGKAPGNPRRVAELPTGKPTWIVAKNDAAEKKLQSTAETGWPVSWSRKDRKAYSDQITDDYVHAEIASPNDFSGREAALAELDMYAKAVPDQHIAVESAWTAGDVVVIRFTYKGTMKGPIGSIKPTNKPIVIHGIDVDDFKGGKLLRAATYSNAVELLTHLGVLPPK